MKREVLIVLPAVVAGIALLLFILYTRPKNYVEGRLEVGTAFGGMNDEGVVELTVHKWLVTDDAVYTLEFLPGCELAGIKDDPEGEKVFVGDKWIGLKPGARYRAKGNVDDGGLVSSRHGERSAKTMQVQYFKYLGE